MRLGAHTLAVLAQAGDVAARETCRMVKALAARADNAPTTSPVSVLTLTTSPGAFERFPCHWWRSDMFCVHANPTTTHLFDAKVLNAP